MMPLRDGRDQGFTTAIPPRLGVGGGGNHPKSSVVDKNHRAHDVPNLFLVDGIPSSL